MKCNTCKWDVLDLFVFSGQCISSCTLAHTDHVRIQRGRVQGSRPPQKKHENIGFLSNTGPDTLKTKPALDVGPTSARQQTPFQWRLAGGP